jgi:hypothetical protein
MLSVIVKGFERMVMAHINSILPASLDPLQVSYPPNRSIDEAISTALHTALTHLDTRNTDVRMLFIDYSSAFNTIVPSKLVTKLRTLGLNTSLCNWILRTPDRLPPGGEGRQHHLHHADTQHWGPTGVCA